MAKKETMVQTTVSVDGIEFLLAQDQNIGELRAQIEDAAATSGRFVDFVVVGNRSMSVLITGHSRVAIGVATVQFDERDTGDLEFPYGGHFDHL